MRTLKCNNKTSFSGRWRDGLSKPVALSMAKGFLRFNFGFRFLHNLFRMFDKSLGGNAEKPETIQEIAVKLVEVRLLQSEVAGPKERTVFVLGSKGVGKSTVLHKFFDREENTRPTLALEYSFGRRTGATVPQQLAQKQLLNVWELGSLTNAQQLVEVPLRTHGVENLAVVIMLDLAQPQRVWLDLECAYRGLKDACTKILSAAQWQGCRERMVERLKKEHVDADTLELLPFPLVIVGGKYDVFKDFDPELKKHVCRCLRSLAHLVGGSLLFYSNQMPKLAKTLRDTVSHLGFGSPSNPFRAHTTDYNEALSIWFGTDSWTDIGGANVFGGDMEPVARIGALLGAEVPQLQAKGGEQQPALADPAKDAGFRESLIDDMRAQMDEELQSMVREAQLRGQFEAVATPHHS